MLKFPSLKTMEKYHLKIVGLIILIVSFAVIYSLLDSSHFHGINPLEDKIKDKIVEKEVKQDQEFNDTFNTYQKQEVKQNIKDVVESEEDKIANPSTSQTFFDRIYFSTITACLLGYGDIYPATNTTKLLAAIQSFLTVCLILY